MVFLVVLPALAYLGLQDWQAMADFVGKLPVYAKAIMG